MSDSSSQQKIIIGFTGRGMKVLGLCVLVSKREIKCDIKTLKRFTKPTMTKHLFSLGDFFSSLPLYHTVSFLGKGFFCVSVFFSMAVYLHTMRSAVKHGLECQDKWSSCPLLINSPPQQRIANEHII